MKSRPLCRHCCTRYVNRPRGMCWSCYYRQGVRDLYPTTQRYLTPQEQQERDDRIANLEADGVPIKEIAVREGICKSRVHQILIRILTQTEQEIARVVASTEYNP